MSKTPKHDKTTLYHRTDEWGWKSTTTTGCGNNGFRSYDEAIADAWINRTHDTYHILIGNLCRVDETDVLVLWEPAMVRLVGPEHHPDIEVDTMREVHGLLKTLDKPVRERVVKWIMARFDIRISLGGDYN